MKRGTIRTIFSLLFLTLALPAVSYAVPELRTALVIGNGAYTTGPLKNPMNDAADMAAALQRTGFAVTLKKNAKLQEMEEAIENFGITLRRGGVGLFYFAGHGVQVNGVNYLLPIGAKINKESDVKYQAVDANRVLDEMANANNGLNIVMLDACRDNPFAKSFRSASRGLAIVSSAPTGTFISYSTGPGQVARDGGGRNSPYTGALLQYMKEPGIPITDMFMRVRQKLRQETGQVPWELSSLEGKFFFVPRKSGFTEGTIVPERKSVADDELQAERAKLEAERAQLQKEKELLEQRKSLDEERRKLEEERRQLAVIKTPVEDKGNDIFKGTWKNSNGSIVKGDGNQFVVVEPRDKGRTNAVAMKDIRNVGGKWVARRAAFDNQGRITKWIDAELEISGNKITRYIMKDDGYTRIKDIEYEKID